MAIYQNDPGKSSIANSNSRREYELHQRDVEAKERLAKASEDERNSARRSASLADQKNSAEISALRAQERESDSLTDSYRSALEEIRKRQNELVEIERKRTDEIVQIEKNKADRIVAIEKEKSDKIIQIEEEKKQEFIATERAKRDHLEKEVNEPHKFFLAQEEFISVRTIVDISNEQLQSFLIRDPEEELLEQANELRLRCSRANSGLLKLSQNLSEIDIRYLNDIDHKRELKSYIETSEDYRNKLHTEAEVVAAKLVIADTIRLQRRLKFFDNLKWSSWIQLISRRNQLESSIIKNWWHGLCITSIPLTFVALAWQWHLNYEVGNVMIILTGAFLFLLSYRLFRINLFKARKDISDQEIKYTELFPEKWADDLSDWSVKSNDSIRWTDGTPYFTDIAKAAVLKLHIENILVGKNENH